MLESDNKDINYIPVLQGVCSVFLVGIGHLLIKFIEHKEGLAEFLRVIIIISPFISFLLIRFLFISKNKTKMALTRKIEEIRFKADKILANYSEEEERLRRLLEEQNLDSSIRVSLEKNITEILNKKLAIINKMAEDINQC